MRLNAILIITLFNIFVNNNITHKIKFGTIDKLKSCFFGKMPKSLFSYSSNSAKTNKLFKNNAGLRAYRKRSSVKRSLACTDDLAELADGKSADPAEG